MYSKYLHLTDEEERLLEKLTSVKSCSQSHNKLKRQDAATVYLTSVIHFIHSLIHKYVSPNYVISILQHQG